METVTADTNLYVSALNFGGRPLRFLERARAGAIRLAVSDDIEAEVRRVLSDKFDWPATDLDQLTAELPHFTVRAHPTRRVAVVHDDPSDNRILECALASGSTVVVSGDKHLLRLGRFEGIAIMRVGEYLDRRPSPATPP